MENKRPQNNRTTSARRSGSPAGGAARSGNPAGRSRPVGAQSGRRPPGFAAAPKRARTQAKPGVSRAKKRFTLPKLPKFRRREKPIRNKRGRRRTPGWLKYALIGAAALIVLVIAMVLIFGGEDTTYHQLPRIWRSGESAFTPQDTNAPEGAPESPTAAPETGEDTVFAPEFDASFDEGDADLLDVLNALAEADT